MFTHAVWSAMIAAINNPATRQMMQHVSSSIINKDGLSSTVADGIAVGMSMELL